MPVNVNAPTAPLEIFVSVTVGRFVFVNVQTMFEPAEVAAASRTSAPVARFGTAVPPEPKPVQIAEAKTYPPGIVSVIVVDVAAAVSVCKAPETPVPDVTVVIVWLAQPLLPVKVKPPTSPLLIFVRVTVGSFVFVNVQAMLEPADVAAALKATAPVTRFGVAVPPLPSPLQVADAKT